MRLPLLIAIALLLVGCHDAPPRGSAQDLAAGASARADRFAIAADSAAIDAAAKAGQAAALEQAAKEHPTEARIAAAVDARVAASAARAVADALEQERTDADADALKAAAAAQLERQAENKAKDDASWLYLCRCIGLAGVVGGALIGGLICWAMKAPGIGIPIGSIIAACGMLATAFGATVTWLPAAVGISGLAGLGAWAWAHRRSVTTGMALSNVSTALSKTVDALEGTASATVTEAKQNLAAVVAASGLSDHIEQLRDGWRSPPLAA